MRRKDKQILWPAYFDLELTKRQGRQIAKNFALKGVKVEEIFDVARELELKPVLLANTAHPRQPWLKRGAVLIDKKESKTRIVKEIARRIRKSRSLK